jgi:hypothetical protein
VKLGQYREEMQIQLERIESQRREERQAHDDRSRAALDAFLSDFASQQHRRFEEMMNRMIENKASSAVVQEDEEIHPSRRLSPMLSPPSSSVVEEPQDVFVRCVECNQSMRADGDNVRCAHCQCEKRKQIPTFTYRRGVDPSPADSSEEDDDDRHLCIDCHDQLDGEKNALRCPSCHQAFLNKKTTQAARSSVKPERMPALQHDGLSSPTVNNLKKVLAQMRASTHTPSRPVAKNISRHEQEAQLRKIKIEAEEIDRVSTSSSTDLEEEAASVLGNVLSRAFTSQQRQMFRYAKTLGVTMTARDRMAAVKEAKELYGTFTGDRAAAPKFLREICTHIQKYDLNIGEVVQMLTSCMKGEAAAWFTAEWSDCCRLPESDKPVQILFHHFIDRWLDGLARRAFRDQLAHTRLQSDRVTQSDLQLHYTKFVETVNNLKMCDRHVQMSDLIEDYYKSLPNMCKTFIGGDFKSAMSIEDIQRKAEQALAFMHVTSTPKQDGSLPKPIAVHAMPMASAPSSTSTQSPRNNSRRNQNRGSKIRMCYHCGSGEHWTGIECPMFAQPQTSNGKTAWKKRNDEKGVTYEYDKAYYEQLSKDIRARRESRDATSRKPSGSNDKRSRQQSTTSHSDPAAASASTQGSNSSRQL